MMILIISIIVVIFKGNYWGPKEGGLNIGQREGSNMQRIESKTRSNQLLLTTPTPWDPP